MPFQIKQIQIKHPFAIGFLSLFFVLQAAPAGQTHSGYSDQLRYLYQKSINCKLCHGPNGLRPIGLDLARMKPTALHLHRLIKSWAALDSDQDGVSNGNELKLGCDPNRLEAESFSGKCGSLMLSQTQSQIQ
ncbi:MAG: hypothetical protein AB7I41_19905 [Candidatus Sericytochromatia bacterium]